MMPMCKNSTIRMYVVRKENQVVTSINITKVLPRMGKKKRKGTKRKIINIVHKCKDPNSHYNNYSINGHNQDKCQKLFLELNVKNHKKDSKKNNFLTMDLANQVERNMDVEENIMCIIVQKEVNLRSLHHKEDKEMNKLIHIKIQVKNTKVDALFNFGSQANLITQGLIKKLGFYVRDHTNPYQLG